MGTLGFWALAEETAGTPQQKSATRILTVARVDDDGTAWAQMPEGGEIPISTATASVKPGDSVTVNIEGGRATISGNATDLPAPSTRVDGVQLQAEQAGADAARAADAAKAAKTIAAEAQSVAQATSQHFFADDNGAHVTDVTQDEWNEAVADDFSDYDPDTKPYHNQLLNSLGILLRTALNNLVSITLSAITFFDGAGNAAANIVARFGVDGFQVGLNSDTHLIGDYHSLQLVDKEGDTYFHVSDLRNASGYATITESFTGDGVTTDFNIAFVYWVIDSVTVDGVDAPYTFVTGHVYTIRLLQAPAAGADVVIAYRTSNSATKAYTLGRRPQGSTIGPYSYAEGYSSTSSAWCSHAEGSSNEATAQRSHAEGWMTEASGEQSHAEGDYTVASGQSSHAQNQGTIAASDNQTAMGRYNVEDASDKYALIVGNGTSGSNRSNAFTVDWDGNGEFAGDVSCEDYQTHDNAHSFASPTASGNVYGNTWNCYDSRGTQVGYAQTANTPTGVCRSFAVRNPRSGSAGNVAMYLYSNDDGTMDANLTAGCTWRADDIPNLPASKITSGTLGVARIPSLTLAKISDAGTLAGKDSVSISTSDWTDKTSSTISNWAAASYKEVDVAATSPSGYWFGGVTKIVTDHSSALHVTGWRYTSGHLYVRLYNISSNTLSSTTVTVSVRFFKVTVS